ncbi:NUDIX hydrolase [Photorhabdus asymbiotica]|uniref:NUDIX hydrolase n=1 Tax=Photorhabdus asymbiotica TaxID=291112 RepID=UPI003DA74F33
MKTRNSARALLINSKQEILLFKFSFEEIKDSINAGLIEFWVTPGGGLKEGESFEQALNRELREEVGLILRSTPEWVWVRNVVLEWKGEKFLSHERYFLVYEDHCDKENNCMTEKEIRTLKDMNWWSLQALLNSSEDFRPPNIGQEIQKIIYGNYQNFPIEVD